VKACAMQYSKQIAKWKMATWLRFHTYDTKMLWIHSE